MDVERNQIWTTNNGLRQEQPSLSLSSSNAQTISNTAHSEPSTNIDRNGSSKPMDSNLVGVQSRFRRQYYHKVLTILLILLILILIITIIIVAKKSKTFNTICKTKECLRTASNLIYSMDEKIDPCEDFYQFVCGNWADEHPKPDSVTSNDWFRERQSKVMRKVRDFLNTNISTTEPEAVTKTKHLYSACMNVDLLDDLALEPLIQTLKELKLPLIPSALNITMKNRNETNEFNWIETIVGIKKSLLMDVIIGFDVYPDPTNRTINRIAFGTPESDAALPFNDDVHKLLRKVKRKFISALNDDDGDGDVDGDIDGDDQNENINNNNDDDDIDEVKSTKETSAGLNAYINYMKNVIGVIVLYVEPDANLDEVLANGKTCTQRSVKIAKDIYKLKGDAENSTKISKNPIDDLLYVTPNELQNFTDILIAPQTIPIWKDYLSFMLESKLNSSLDDLEILTSKADIDYLQQLSEYLLDISPSDMEFFLWLNTIEELVLHTTSELRELHNEYIHQIINTESSTPRSLYCAHGVNSLMGMAVSYTLADDNFTKLKLPKVQRMLSNIHRSFDNLVRATTWMDQKTKRVTLEKSGEMKSLIGYPEWITNGTALDDYYRNVNVNKSAHLANMIGVLRSEMQTKIDALHKAEAFGWATSPTNVNAFHTFQSNTITIPIAILQYPFYDLGLEALNYGAIGTILGHELTHGFDDSGRMFDKNGNMVQWWSNATINEYINRTECFIEQYNRYILPDIGEHIDGELTLSENIADNGGLREAFYAYRIYVNQFGVEKLRLPGLEKYTHEQLLFIAFGNLWCETYTPAASRYALDDSHCPGRIRLKGVLSNSGEFARTFHCHHGSGMYPDRKVCKIW